MRSTAEFFCKIHSLESDYEQCAQCTYEEENEIHEYIEPPVEMEGEQLKNQGYVTCNNKGEII